TLVAFSVIVFCVPLLHPSVTLAQSCQAGVSCNAGSDPCNGVTVCNTTCTHIVVGGKVECKENIIGEISVGSQCVYKGSHNECRGNQCVSVPNSPDSCTSNCTNSSPDCDGGATPTCNNDGHCDAGESGCSDCGSGPGNCTFVYGDGICCSADGETGSNS